MLTLRDYQDGLVADVTDAFNRTRRVCLQLATGGGKTPIFSYLVQQLAKNMRSSLVLAHRRELVRQASAKLTEFEVDHGIVQAGFCESMALSLVGSVQTVVNRLQRMRAPTVIVIDEAHHSVANTWKRILAHWPEAYVLGVTATPDRPDGRGLREVGYGELVIGPPMRTLINQGHLADYDYYAPPTKADLSGVATRAGDYAKDQLAAAMDKAVIVGDALEHYRRIFKGAPAFVFCVSVEHAHHVAEAYRAQGYRAAAVDGDMDMHERDSRIKAFTRGELNALMSCDLIGEGLDVPGAQGAQFLRPSKSLIIFLQQAGRAMRAKADGSRALFLDHVGHYARFGAPCQDREWSLDGAKKAKPTDGASTCKLCYHVFPSKETPKQTGTCPFAQEECPYLQVGEMLGGRTPPDQVDGELKRVDIHAKYDMRPPWGGGIDISTARGFDWKLLLERADTREKLEHIRLVRGYAAGWVFLQMQARGQRRAVA